MAEYIKKSFLKRLVNQMTAHKKVSIIDSPNKAFAASMVAFGLGAAMLVVPQYFFLMDIFVMSLGLALLVMSFLDWTEGMMIKYMWQDIQSEELFTMNTADIPVKEGYTYIGHGARWDKEERMAIELLLKYDSERIRPEGESALGGYSHLHGIIKYKEQPIFIKNSLLAQHMMVYGASGCGKSVGIETIVVQAIRRGEPIFIIDPKGTDDMINRVYSECVKGGVADKFRLFAPLQYPKQSIKWAPFADFAVSTEPADRTGPLLGDQSDTFVKFCWGVINTVVNGLIYIGEPVEPRTMERYALRDPWILVKKCLIKSGFPGSNALKDDGTDDKDIEKIAEQYKNSQDDEDVDTDRAVLGCIDLALKPGENYSKMVNNLLEFFSLLNTGPTGDCLNPKAGDPDVFSWDECVEKNQVVYFALGSTISKSAAYKLGKLAILDLLSYGGRSYAYVRKEKYKPVNLIIDELNNVVMNEYVDVVNKLRGTKIRTYNFTQTMQDLAAELPSENEAYKLMGSIAINIQMKDETYKTSEYFSLKTAEVLLTSIKRSFSSSGALGGTGDQDIADFKASVSKSMSEEKDHVVVPDYTMHMPIGQGFMNMGSGTEKIRFPMYQEPEYNYLEEIGVK